MLHMAVYVILAALVLVLLVPVVLVAATPVVLVWAFFGRDDYWSNVRQAYRAVASYWLKYNHVS